MKIEPLDWSEIKEPEQGGCSYHHVTATTPLGDFRITWKGWKEYPKYALNQFPWDRKKQSWISAYTLEEAKEKAEKEYKELIQKSITEE